MCDLISICEIHCDEFSHWHMQLQMARLQAAGCLWWTSTEGSACILAPWGPGISWHGSWSFQSICNYRKVSLLLKISKNWLWRGRGFRKCFMCCYLVDKERHNLRKLLCCSASQKSKFENENKTAFWENYISVRELFQWRLFLKYGPWPKCEWILSLVINSFGSYSMRL